jgi:hypothetical protein
VTQTTLLPPAIIRHFEDGCGAHPPQFLSPPPVLAYERVQCVAVGHPANEAAVGAEGDDRVARYGQVALRGGVVWQGATGGWDMGVGAWMSGGYMCVGCCTEREGAGRCGGVSQGFADTAAEVQPPPPPCSQILPTAGTNSSVAGAARSCPPTSPKKTRLTRRQHAVDQPKQLHHALVLPQVLGVMTSSGAAAWRVDEWVGWVKGTQKAGEWAAVPEDAPASVRRGALAPACLNPPGAIVKRGAHSQTASAGRPLRPNQPRIGAAEQQLAVCPLPPQALC